METIYKSISIVKKLIDYEQKGVQSGKKCSGTCDPSNSCTPGSNDKVVCGQAKICVI